ncbi:LLM class flavin-dependent oxidoreductase [Roseomonas sp. GC11]|uniref:LLM class flavin-dependent oxidoreductase n=1 Tax=Roseomonas sp. GC11 TaxID=2950546 RepID=UPI00210F1E36|nr:LLM class flavin-dependent oxidoreductase [Roseomonas sp. GC11]MCQ4159059.1 LLM class flavin-dependent oxidoreductase [Roseomonas sp. GC11]
MRRQLHLNLFIHGRGHHESAWRHPAATPLAMTDLAYYQDLARRAEDACFDAIFFADHLVLLPSEIAHAVQGGLEPLTLLAALATGTRRIGLVATASTSYTEPFNLARQFASLDHISHGRVGWNIVTTWLAAASRNFGRDAPPGLEERYAQAEDFLAVVTKLWDSWARDAVLDDRARGRFARPDRVRRFDHHGPFYQVSGPLNVPRGPQGRPVLVQAGSSGTGKRFAARHAEVIFTAHLEQGAAIAFRQEIRALAAGLGRDPEGVVILPGISAAIGGTEREAQRIWDELNESAAPEVGLERLSARFGGHDFSHLPLDRALSVDDFPPPAGVQAARSRAEVITDLVARERPTLRALLHRLAAARGHYTMAGTPEQVADVIEAWFRSGAADGFNVMPPILPAQFEAFTSEVVPLLRRRGLFREAYDSETLRGHLGLPEPANQFFGAEAEVLV